MEIITFDSLQPRKDAINESLSTMGRQIWDNIKHVFNTENWTSNDADNANYLKAKRKYFDELYTITPSLKAKLVQWCRKVPGILALSPSEMNQMLSATNNEQRTQNTTYVDPHSGAYYNNTSTYDYHERNELTMQRKARVNNARNSMTYSTCSYVLHDGNKAYLLFFTFDSDGIDVCQVATHNKYSSGGMQAGIDFVRLPQWNGVQKSEYTK